MSTEGAPDSPIFILGVLPRSGTNFLYDLLLLHPDCERGIVAEDHLLTHAALLVDYAELVSRSWNARWKIRSLRQPDKLIASHLGKGLLSFLALRIGENGVEGGRSGARLLTKTPNITNINHFFTLFPDAHLIVIVRDGRSVVESGIVTFNWNFEVMSHAWAASARAILEFQRHPATGKHLLVKYEDLHLNTEAELRRILSFLELDEARYEFATAANLPVRGSSELHKKGDEHRHWRPVEKATDFDPIARWSHWSRARRERFHGIAGEYLVRFGYCRPEDLNSAPLWKVWNVIQDVKWSIRTLLARVKRLGRNA